VTTKLGLRDIPLKTNYESDEDDILREFYIPALSESVLYKRLSGFFSSTSLAIAAKGICGLISNGGRIELVCGAQFSEADVEAIKDAYASPESLIEDNMLSDIDNMVDKFIQEHIRAFGWMLANGLLTIKIAIVYDEIGAPLDYRTIDQKAIFHQKVGILEDIEGNRLSFSGSQNETASGWFGNIEEFKVFRDWIDSEIKYFEADLNKFQKYWSGIAKKVKVIELPEAVKNKLIEISPNEFEDLNLEKWYVFTKKRKKHVILREYQKEAITKWLLNNRRGIFEMATGTGKTYAALGCLNSILKNEMGVLAIITCPNNHLIPQWCKNIDDFGIKSDIIIADSTNPKWKKELVNNIIDIEIGTKNNLIIMTTHSTFSSDKFKKIIEQSESCIFLIVDEVHGIGSPQRRKGLLERYNYRLGLSATPKRWFDPEGTEALFNYFDKIVYRFPLSKAVGQYLTHYEYHPHFVSLTDEELEKYENETKKIARAYYVAKNDDERENWYKLLCYKRQNVVKTAYNKYHILRKIINTNKDIKHCIIYCAPEQLEMVQDILLENNIIQHKFTKDEGTHPKKEYGGISERDYILNQFSKGIIQVLVAMKCLDQGVDVPPARFAIMMSNSGNPMEYIQRRGRVLRRYPGKQVAIIHDVIVTPKYKYLKDSDLARLEKKIFKRELIRYKEFSSLANNVVDCYKKIERLEEEYG